MQPYQNMEEEIQRQNQLPLKDINTAFNIGSSLAGASLLAKGLPLVNKLIPQDLSMKGLSKISPILGKFAKKALNEGFSFDDVRDFISENAEKKKSKGIFQQLIGDVEISTLPESQRKQLGFLQMAAEELEKKGVGPNDEPFKKLAKKVKDVLKGKTKVLEAEAMEQQPIFTTQEDLARHNANYEAQQTSQQAGPGQQALMAILQKIQAQRAGGG